MAKTMRGSTPEVETWVQTTMMLIEASSTYAEGGQYDPDTDGMIRRIRVVASALQAALMSVNIMPPMGGPMAGPMASPQPTSGATPQPESGDTGASAPQARPRS